MPGPTPTNRSRMRALASLNWRTTPSRIMPHGLVGIVSVALGAHLVVCHSLAGNLRPYARDGTHDTLGVDDVPVRVMAYALAAAWNALGGYRIAHAAPPASRPIFRRCAVLQGCLAYFVLRFLPHASMLLLGFESDVVQRAVRWLDAVVTTTSVLCTLSFFEAVIDLSKTSVILGQSVGVGIMGILLLSVYPIQLSVQGEEWWTCIQHRYPRQASGMVAYIYVPATVTFSLMLFGATLYQRKILAAKEFGVASMLIVVVCLLAAVLSQEVHIPDVSTQRIYLPCEDPPAGSFEDRILQALDFSRYARSILTQCFGMEFAAKDS